MNLSKLFEMQRVLDEKIIVEKDLGDMDQLPYLILALQVELGECANEWRGFKFWSKDMEPRVSKHTLKKEYRHLHITQTDAYEYQLRNEFGEVVFEDVTDSHHDHTNPLLEEYVDCLHFILSIGLHLEIEDSEYQEITEEFTGTIEAFQHTFNWIVNLEYYRNEYPDRCRKCYENLIGTFAALGTLLGFTWEQIEQAYCDKNEVNHQRQTNGY